MEAGKNIVTSNKALVATFYDDLIPYAESHGLKFRCTAAVGGGIGWLSEVERSRRIQSIHQVGGIMNGTCNYILDSMTRLGLDYSDALRQAQDLGYAEADPSTDVDGIDTWHKLIVSANIAFGVSLDRSAIPAAGIRHISAADVEAFSCRGYTCKLVSTAIEKDGIFSAWVQPTLFPQGQPEAAVPTNYNLITLVGDVSGRQSFFGQGAGRYPTAYNVVQDLVDLLEGKGFYSVYGETVDVDNSEDLTWYVRGNWQGEAAEHWGDAVIVKNVSVAAMHAWRKENPEAFIAAFQE
jgi:homoserine dehydrogenase